MEPWVETFAQANFRRSADTAHDLKTPLNVAVLNLELLRMRLRKLVEGEDDKISDAARAIETELRRMAQIFDCFFLLSTPPKNEEAPEPIDAAAIATEEAATVGLNLQPSGKALVRAHETRLRQACKRFFDGSSKLLAGDERRATAGTDNGVYSVTVTGSPESADIDLTRIFKLYYTDPLGNPDLSLAIARLIAETYGGGLNAVEESGKVSLRLFFPLGA